MTDLFIDSTYGDFVVSNDIVKLVRLEVLTNVANERIKTNSNDFRLAPSLGADLEKFVGSSIDQQLIDDMVLSIEYALTYDSLFDAASIETIPVRVSEHQLYFRTTIKAPEGTIVTNMLYDNGE